MDLNVRDRVYVITGGARGLGRATADQLVADGARVVLSGRSRDSLDAAVAELGEGAVAVEADNSDPAAPGRLVAAAQDTWGRLDGVLISVGGPPKGSVTGTSDADWTTSFESVFLGAVRVAREVAAVLEEGGSITFVLSVSAKAPLADMAISNGLRPGLAMVAKQLADELGPRGIRVNGLMPGRIDTERVRELDAAGGDAEASKAQQLSSIPLRRYGTPDEFGRTAAFLMSPASGFVSGVLLAVDGGLSRPL
ncbi:SDR family oxidoreductase [Nocardioides sp. Root151]|uniref:SDR family oxidoreductase n=1 Tax=Nocardioides sp. Root151 TaxID=1736475 RepID=UPI0007028DC0|nr:SDR family oxidoreductase [Nocardioides sp. Root151]KQZ70295.1 oxidoreductase [Nocardioides sp. Root151]